MKKTIVSILLIFSFWNVFGQNEKPLREAFTLTLAIDGKQFYEQKVEESPYFVKDQILQIYPGETLLVEVETKKKAITSMKVVKENLNPDKTLKIEFKQMVKDSISKSMILVIDNPFKRKLKYEALMYIVGHNQWIETNVIPVGGFLSSYESWPDVIITLALSDWKLI